MKITHERIEAHNKKNVKDYHNSFLTLKDQLSRNGVRVDSIIERLISFKVAIPSWALGAVGTRFGRFSIGGEPGSLEEKIEDVGLLHTLNRSSGAISLHIPRDVPDDIEAVKEKAENCNLKFDAVNSNTFQDRQDQIHSYKYGSLCHTDPEIRKQAIEHNIDVIKIGESLGSKAITIWLADGSNFPGQQNFRQALHRTYQSLEQVYDHLPPDWKMLTECKPYEPNFYSMVIPDWGTSYLLSSKLGKKASVLVDLGHHLPNTNIEQIVATLMLEKKLGGFHFNDFKYEDDDLTAGSIKPYQLFLIFFELTDHSDNNKEDFLNLSWMIDTSHNIKDPLEDLLQSVEAIKNAFAKALLVDRKLLENARQPNDVVKAQMLLQQAFQTDVRPLLRESRMNIYAAIDPVGLFRELEVRKTLIEKRGATSFATGL